MLHFKTRAKLPNSSTIHVGTGKMFILTGLGRLDVSVWLKMMLSFMNEYWKYYSECLEAWLIDFSGADIPHSKCCIVWRRNFVLELPRHFYTIAVNIWNYKTFVVFKSVKFLIFKENTIGINPNIFHDFQKKFKSDTFENYKSFALVELQSLYIISIFKNQKLE